MHVLITLVGKGYAPECMRISTHVYNNNGRDYRIAISGIAVGDKQKNTLNLKMTIISTVIRPSSRDWTDVSIYRLFILFSMGQWSY